MVALVLAIEQRTATIGLMVFVLPRRQRERTSDADRILRLRVTLVLPQYRAY